MRQVKYKAWDKIEKEWIDIKHIGFENGELWYVQAIDENDRDIDPPYFPDSNDIELIEYTGMKDDDNNEIWEGNIVQFTSTLCGDKLIRTVVEYNENIGSFVFEMGNDEGFWQYDASMNNIKVIGNVYEQPELISL